ncbi:NAD(P)-dependent alcohol dehydrogenase [Paenibacillus glycinis]|uniref:Zinc-binding dehydrogenase n=1 Tax=Paenibacillus glycinis TaxID=2697035 RepID=A0ABW9XWT1_9BACL|nr:NAD(P)-dependent alcohol dehydrogenase [Paenibacillus glycinis]NBD27167.1 zinc-binding dehydrogenase [Paenibacillus glycinis]
MKAVICAKYGTPDVLRFTEVPAPVPGEGQIRVRVRAAVVTPSDCSFRKADPFIVRFVYGLARPRNPILGVELAGDVESVGRSVTAFKPGDRVFGVSPRTFGAHAEFNCLDENGPLAIMPANLTYEEAAGLSDGAPTALIFLRDIAAIRPGQKLLINGASGAVGAYAVQLAKHYGADVTGVCSTDNLALVQSLGADKVIDYTRTDFTAGRQTYDAIFDAVGKSSFPRCAGALTPQGVYLSTSLKPTMMVHALRTAKREGKKARFVAAGLRQTRANFDFLRELAEAGGIRPVIDRRYPLEQAAEAHRYVETGRKKGNVILTL